MRRAGVMAASGLSFVLAGCSTAPKPSDYSQAQLNAIETREVDASMEQTYTAASSAMFDAGYTIVMSDRAGGLITGYRGEDKSNERFWVNPYIHDTAFTVSMQVREVGPGKSQVRVKTAVNGEPVVDQKAIDALWVLMQRQVLMKDPLASLQDAPAGGKAKPKP